MTSSEVKASLEEARATFRERCQSVDAAAICQGFSGRIAAVLSGGGALGAYEAGALLAFQDARLPTHTIVGSSVGSINAASFAAQSDTLVGNAEPLVQSWFELTPPGVGIEWSRYLWRQAGLVTAWVGFWNLLSWELAAFGFSFSLDNPALFWLELFVGGSAAFFFYDRLPYIGYAVRNFFHKTSWRPDRGTVGLSLIANLTVWICFVAAVASVRPHIVLAYIIHSRPTTYVVVVGLGGLVTLVALLHYILRGRSRILLRRLVGLPQQPGLFTNFERDRLLRYRISTERLSASPIDLAFTVTDMESGAGRFFSNRGPEDLAASRGADVGLIREGIFATSDLIGAITASSSLPIVYEPARLDGRVWGDGAIIGNQSTRLAIGLGADVIFLIMMRTPQAAAGQMNTFLDAGLRALDLLISQQIVENLRILTNINRACEGTAARLGIGPEEVEIEIDAHRYRYIKNFIVQPSAPLGGTMLDFTADTISPAILQGYHDASAQVEEFLAYAPRAKCGLPKRRLRLAAEHYPSGDYRADST